MQIPPISSYSHAFEMIPSYISFTKYKYLMEFFSFPPPTKALYLLLCHLLSLIPSRIPSEERWFWICGDGAFEIKWGILGIDNSEYHGKACCCGARWSYFMGHAVPTRIWFVSCTSFLLSHNDFFVSICKCCSYTMLTAFFFFFIDVAFLFPFFLER